MRPNPLGPPLATTGCKPQIHNGFSTPDPTCTPGAINPTVTLAVLKNLAFRTGCLRDCSRSATQKGTTYASYKIARPANNNGTNQICELDHVVPLEIGGADTLDNIWPQCGPKNVALAKRYFKEKDLVENYLVDIVNTQVTDHGNSPTYKSSSPETGCSYSRSRKRIARSRATSVEDLI